MLLHRHRVALGAALADLPLQRRRLEDGVVGEPRPRSLAQVGVQLVRLQPGQQGLAAGEAVQRHALALLRGEAQVVGGELDLQHLDLVATADEQAGRLAGGGAERPQERPRPVHQRRAGARRQPEDRLARRIGAVGRVGQPFAVNQGRQEVREAALRHPRRPGDSPCIDRPVQGHVLDDVERPRGGFDAGPVLCFHNHEISDM